MSSYNLRISMERHGSNIVSQIEVSGVGRAGRKVITSKDFDTAQADLKAAHDEIVGNVEAYHKPVINTTQVEKPKASKPAAKAKAKAKPKASKPKDGIGAFRRRAQAKAD